MATIIAVCEHTGGALGLLPVVRQLRASGHTVRFIAGGEAAIQALQNAREEFEVRFSGQEVYARHPIPDVLLTSLCTTTGLIMELITWAQGACPVVGLQGPGGGGIHDEWSRSLHRPDYMCVHDKETSKELLVAWRKFPKSHVLITGFPNLDRYVGYYEEQAAHELRSVHNIPRSIPIVLFVGDTDEGTSRELEEVVSVLNGIGEEIVFAARPHPRMMEESPRAFGLWQEAVQKVSCGRVIDISAYQDIRSWIACSQVVVGRASTAMMEAAHLQKQVVSIWYPEGQKAYSKATGRIEFPWAAKKCVATATTKEQLWTLLQRGLEGKLGLAEAQKRYLPRTDTRASKRIVQHIESMIQDRA